MNRLNSVDNHLNLSGWNKSMNRNFTFCVIVSLLFFTAGAFGASRNVPGTYPNIQAGIDAAGAGDEVVVASGIYLGAGNRNLDFGGKAITVRSASGNPAVCVIDCQNAGRGFYFHSGETTASVVRGFTIINADANTLYYGGAIECEGASPTIDNCIITDSDAAYGGAIDCYNASPLIKNCVMTGNTADFGGAIECSVSSSPTIFNCLIYGNAATYTGGAIDCYDNSSPTINNCTIANNTGADGKGGIYASNASHPTVKNSILWNNGDDIDGATATYSCIEDNDSGTGNVHTNPLFKTGPLGNYYLGQIAAGQLADSNCINTGDSLASVIFGAGHLRTTRTDKVADSDSSKVDMGYHYLGGGTTAQYILTTIVDGNSPWGTLTPISGLSYKQYADVQLTAVPDPNYEVGKWTGTNNDSSMALTNVVTMDANHTVVVKFRSVVMYGLTTTVIGSNGTIDPYNNRQFRQHTSVTINTSPTPGYVIKNWRKGNTAVFDVNNPGTYTIINDPNTFITILIEENTTIGVEFKTNPVTYLLDARVTGEHGTVIPRRGQQPGGMIVQLTATPDVGYKVKKWTGTDNDSSTAATNTVTMTGAKTVYVEFVAIPTYTLVAGVNDANFGSISSAGGTYPEGTVVPLTVTPAAGYRVKSWTGADNTPAWNVNTNTVTMTSNKTVTVAFEVNYNRTIYVPGKFPYITIQDAINSANNGDTIRIAPGTYPGSGFFISQSITIVGEPEHPENVVIDGNNFSNRIFELRGSGTITLNGLTIANAKYYAPTHLNGVAGPWSSTHFRHDGGGGGNAFGAGIFMSGNHIVVNCIIRNCIGKGGDARNGLDGDPWDLTAEPKQIPIHKGGYGGEGGWAAGSGIYVLSGSPKITNTIVEDCQALGGYGGGGGNGLDASTNDPFDPNFPGGPGGNGGNGGNAFGAGIFCDWSASPTFTACTVRNCEAIAGYGGDGGLGGVGARGDMVAFDPCDANSFVQRGYGQGGHGGLPGLAYGGGVYIDPNSTAKFNKCTITGNSAQGNVGGCGGNSSGDIVNSWNQGGVGALVDIDTLNRVIADLIWDVNDPCTAGVDPNHLLLPRQITINGTFTSGMTINQVWNMITPISPEVYTARGGGVYIGSSNGIPTAADFNDCQISDNWTKGSTSGMGGYNTGGLFGRYNSTYEYPSRHYRIPSYGNGVYLSDDSNTTFLNCNIVGNYYTIENTSNIYPLAHDQFIAAGLPVAGSPGTESSLLYRLIYGDEYLSYGGGLCFDGLAGSATRTVVRDCNIADNNSANGGGIYADTTQLYIADSNIAGNLSYSGGGILAIDSTGSVNKSTVTGNAAGTQSGSYSTGYAFFGFGGGVYVLSSRFDVNDTVVTENFAGGGGGGICYDGDCTSVQVPLIKNCLITDNKATYSGGGIAAIYFAEPQIQNCTVANNVASDVNGSGGGLFASYAASVTVRDTIFWNNIGVKGSQIGLSDSGVYTAMPARLNMSFSDVDLEYSSGVDLTDTGAGSGATAVAAKLVDSTTIYSEINSNGTAKVIVTLTGAAAGISESINWSSPQEVSDLRAGVVSLQNQVLGTLSAGEFTLRQKLTNAAIFSGQVNAAGLNKLAANPNVAHIEPVRTVRPMLAQAIPLANAMGIRPVYNGSGISIAIVDSGVDYNHPRLGGGGFPNSKVIGGYDTGDRDNDPAPSDEAHGTACAGIAAGGLGTVGDYIGGVAYNAKIYALKLSADDGAWPTDSTLAAWDWCLTHKNDSVANPILAVSNSWGMYSNPIDNSADADTYSPAHTATAQRLVNAGITILAASGNDGFAGEGIAWPSAMSNVISVGAVYDTTDEVTEYSNTADILDILAPADPVYTTDIVGARGYSSGDYYPYFNGTSSACPFAAGSVVALQSAAKQITGVYLSPAQVRSILVASGKAITDTKVAITKPRVDVGAAIGMISPTEPVHTETGCVVTGLQQDANDIWEITPGSGNIAEDPNFVLGYYLGRVKTGQDANSPCIDAGSMSAVAAQLEKYTTRLDGVFDDADDDANIVDMGYHYKTGITGYGKIYDITVQIIEDANYPGIHGTISAEPSMFASHPDSATYEYSYYAGMTPTFTATPDSNYSTAGWYDANDVRLSSSDSYQLTVNSDKTIFVKFSKAAVTPSRNLYVPSDYPSLQYAINDAIDGDKIILAMGTYFYNDTNFDDVRIDINGKNIIIASSNPDDPCVVAATIIRGNGFRISNVDSTMVLDGITIRDAHYGGGTPDCTVSGPTGDGLNGGNIYGGAMRLINASPTIRNCRFIDCSAHGGDACPGTGTAGDGGWAGYAYGGAIGIDSTSGPYIKNCDFINCFARGGNAGDGAAAGHGGTWGDPSDDVGHTWDWAPTGGYMDYWYYSGRGGAIYVMDGGKAQIENCLFQGNRAYSGHSGKSAIDAWPNYWYAIDAYGGAVYIAQDSEVNFVDCNFIDNEADTRNQLVDANGYDGDVVIYSPVISFGGGIYAEGSTFPKLINCQFTTNRACVGGGINLENSIAYIGMSKFENCSSMYGGAIAFIDSNSILLDCLFRGNFAYGPAGQGGGIYSASSALNFYDCVLEQNTASASGGGAYFGGILEPNMHNCLIAKNNAGRDGGGISANWNAGLGLSNCTIAGNTALSYGGGVSTAYEAYVNIINSIIWNNNSEYGKSLSIGSAFEAVDKYDAQASVSYSDLQGGQAGVFVDTSSGCSLNWGSGNLTGTTLTSPLFIAGYWGDYYLSQVVANDPNHEQTVNSPCVDSGEGQAIDHDLFRHTTRTDHTRVFGNAIDSGRTDMGYHYLLYTDLEGDFNYDGKVSYPEDLVRFMDYWLDDGCIFPYYCGGRDLDKDGRVDFEDYAIFASNYGKFETTPPFPNPMTWEIRPGSTGMHEIAMKATTARDISGSPVMYHFVRYSELAGGNRDFGWQTEPNFIDTGLLEGTQYGYQVQARDIRGNMTAFSVIGYAVTGEDTFAPTPNPMTWERVPTAISTSEITMTATTATDVAGVEYYFSRNDGNSSDWQSSPIYTDSGLDANTTYTYQVRARDLSPYKNETGMSTAESAKTLAEGEASVLDVNAPTYTPTSNGLWVVTPYIYNAGGGMYYHYMTAVGATDAQSPPVIYEFRCTNGSGISSGPIVGTGAAVTYTAGPFYSQNHSTYQVIIRDSASPPNQVTSSKWNTLNGLIP
ncbi:MAG: S8 family serine peptidase [Sedimentisphaerales bacterium]